jgi:hypothetical protein
MKKITTDVDVDVFGREDILKGIECIIGRIDRPDGSHEKHNTGVYFQNIPRDPVANVATLDHRIARDYGYFKIDFLNVNMYEGVRSETHLLELIDREPPWDFFQYEEITDQLFHLKGHSNLLVEYKPKSIEDLAMILAIMRPGKAHLQHHSWDLIKKDVWLKISGDESYQFKRAHGIAYATAIVVHLNLLIEKLSNS